MLLPLFLHLAVSCAPRVAPGTLAAIASVESRFDGLAIHDNATSRSYRPRDEAEAIRIAAPLLAAGHSVDLGLMQVNSRNLARVGMTLADAFDPCASLRAGAAILAADYEGAARHWGYGQSSLRAAIRAYNTGRYDRGQPYLVRVADAARGPYLVPLIDPAEVPAGAARSAPRHPRKPAPSSDPPSDWNVFPSSPGPGRLPGAPPSQSAQERTASR